MTEATNEIFKGVNWNESEHPLTQIVWPQLNTQLWLDKEVAVAKDKSTWALLNEAEKEAYKKALGGLNLLDTQQGNEGMPYIALALTNQQQKATLANMAYMENIHAQSYSTIFDTLLEKAQITEVHEWVAHNKQLQYKAKRITDYYRNITDNYSLYMAMVASVFLESFLFYSGFFYPLYMGGNGKLTSSAEMIKLILRDEAIHGVYIGALAQETYAKLSDNQKAQADAETYALLDDLMANEIAYTNELYGGINLAHQVREFLKYNANKALMNLGRNAYYEHEPINPIVLNGLSTETDTHDFFSMKGNGYIKSNVEELSDEDFTEF
jgi:ribonucleoside-diphosphate reductase beta chain